MPTNHAMLAPSSSKRWLSCPPSARLESMMPEKDTAYTREGTIAHGMAEAIERQLLANGATFLNPVSIDAWQKSRAEGLDETPEAIAEWVDKAEAEGLDPWEMMRTVYDKYVQLVMEDFAEAKVLDPDTTMLVEAELKLDEYIPEGFGSSDAVIISGGILMVYDLKYGKGVKVSAKQNTQMLCYALGALLGPAELYDVKTVVMTIIQPRLDWSSTWTISVEELMTWANNVLAPGAKAAFEGKGQTEPGDHCKFCKVAATCRALKDKVLDLDWVQKAQQDGIEDTKLLMSPEEVGEALANAQIIRTWLDSIESYALNEALEGRDIPGWKIVEGTSRRVLADPEQAQQLIIAAGLDIEDYMRPRELRSLSDLEKLLKKKAFNEILGSLVIKPKGKPTLVPDSDPRPAFATSAQDEFKDINV